MLHSTLRCFSQNARRFLKEKENLRKDFLRNYSSLQCTPGRLSDLVLIRHGESEGNVARRRSIRGDHSLYHGEFKNRHSCHWRLTDKGREQAEAAGEWLRANGLTKYERYYVPEYLRAMETAARLNLEEAKWFANILIRERDWGQMDLMSEEERMTQMRHELKRRELDQFYYCPPGGESLASVVQRASRLLRVLNDECANHKVIVVCHREVMWALRTRIERMSQETFRALISSERMVDQLHNGHILHYTRRDPYTGKLYPFFTYMRSICPWNLKYSPQGWQKIDRPVYDNNMLLAIAERVPRMIVSEEYHKETYCDRETNITHVEGLKTNRKFSCESTKNENLSYPVQYTKKPKIELKNVLIVNKTTRLQHESQLHGNTGEALRKQISLRGFIYDRLKASHDHHVEALDDMLANFKERGIRVRVLKAEEMKKEMIADDLDAIFSAGGDGTFLKAASFVNKENHELPVAGLNTDSKRSEGNLCGYSLNGDSNQLLDAIQDGNFEWQYRRRIRVGMVNQHGYKYELDKYALNEIFIAESDPSKPSFYDIGIDQEQRELQRSSGIITCTGTGSSAWYHSASQFHRDDVSKVLRQVDSVVYPDTVTEITERLNHEFGFHTDSPDMGYIVREPIINSAYGDIRHRHGTARRVSIRSLGWNARVYIDSIYSVPLDYGTQAVMKIGFHPAYSLKTFKFHLKDQKNCKSC